MKEKEIKKAFEEIKFSEDLEERFYRNITGTRTGKVRLRKRRLIPVLLCSLISGITICAAVRFDWFGWNYKEKAGLIKDWTDQPMSCVENRHLRMSVEDALFTEELGIVFLHIQAEDDQGKAFMKKYASGLTAGLMMEDGDKKSASACSTQYIEKFSDEENWYYKVMTTDHSAASDSLYTSAEILFPAFSQTESEDNPGQLKLNVPVKETLKESYLFQTCGNFAELSVSNLAVMLSWDMKYEPEQKIDLEIQFKDGSRMTYHRGAKTDENWELNLLSSDTENRRMTLSLVPKEILDIQEIDTILLNGVRCG